MVRGSFRTHEILGLLYQFLGATSIGLGLYATVWLATRSIAYRTITPASGAEWLLFPLLFGVGALLWSLGSIELKEAKPGYRR